MKNFYFLRFSHCNLNPTFINVSSSVFNDLVTDFEDFVSKSFHHGSLKHVNANDFILKNDPVFQSLHVILIPSLCNEEGCIFYDILGFELGADDNSFYSFLFDFKTFPDGSGLPEAVGKVLNQLEKEYSYYG